MRHSFFHLARDAMPRRAACLAAAESNLKICKLGAHVWLYGWTFCGFPIYRIGSLCSQNFQTFMVTFGDLLVTWEGLKDFEALSVADRYWSKPFDEHRDVEVIPNPLTFACILRCEPKRLEKFSKDVLSVDVFNGVNALHYAAALGELDCFSVLLRRLGGSADRELLYCCDARFPFGDRLGVLNLLVGQGTLTLIEDHKDSLQEMLKGAGNFGADWMLSWIFSNFGDDFDLSPPLRLASEKGHTDCCRLLIDSGADVNHRDAFGGTPLMYASREGHTDCCRLLLDSGADVNLREKDGWTALMYTSQEGRADCCRFLIDAGADVNLQKKDGWAALMYASRSGHADCCRLLLDSGADVNLQNVNGWTALMWASNYGDADCCRLLIDSGADLNLQLDEPGWTALILASIKGHDDCCRLLIDSGADVNLQDETGFSALMRASLNRHADCCRLLLDSGADVNLREKDGGTALMFASQIGCCRLLLDSGADVNLQNVNGETALMRASLNGHADCCRLLTDAVNIQTAKGKPL